ncbi:unnamed protein product [Thlaspi arvense]|uniref:F-box associated beta-propeller type 1 domain-containing protein n=1 Tax=Thlaspi arvense TaxID=13288 RepID=A0AAU9RP09_THLAR|nr:unnamed protein product [Thlaspi arvense]
MYSISVNLNDDDPDIKVRELALDIPSLEPKLNVVSCCNGYFLLRDTDYRAVVWNPWLKQSRMIEAKENFRLCGIGYDSCSPERIYKIAGYTFCVGRPIARKYSFYHHQDTSTNKVKMVKEKKLKVIRPLRFVIYETATNSWRYLDDVQSTAKSPGFCGSIDYNVSLNGNLYWTADNLETCFIRMLHCSKEILKPFCILPCTKNDPNHKLGSHALTVFKGDRFSFLEECSETRKIEIWVTKKKITNGDDGDDVVLIKFMSVAMPNFFYLRNEFTSYLVDDNINGKSFVMCCREKTKQACVYIVRGDMCRTIKIEKVVGELQRCCVYVPSLIPIP